MTKPRSIPDRLFKYRSFSNLTLEMLVEDQIFLADPTTFNDPLDTRPTLESDIDDDQLEQVLSQLVTERVTAEMSAAAKAIKYGGPKTVEHIARRSQARADSVIAEIRYNATDPDYETPHAKRLLLCHSIENELLRRYDKGVFALAERVSCPLMWSHYGDQHKGLCLGYSVPKEAMPDVSKVKYGGSRIIQASLLASMLAGDLSAQKRVDEAVLLRKAQPWQYEKEWRYIGPKGLQDTHLELEEITFGMRCAPSVKFAVVRALESRGRKVRFYEIRETRGRFTLLKRALDTDELASGYPRYNLGIWRAFDA